MAFQHILYEVDGPIATVTLNRPDKLNAYTGIMRSELAAAFLKADEDDALRVVILTGAGRAFCAGADISSADAFDRTGSSSVLFQGGNGKGAESHVALSSRRDGGVVGAMFNCSKPIICAFNGAAVGVGLTIALPTDIKIAADTAKFGCLFTRRGLVPEAGSAWFLPRLVGLSQALRWCLTGRIFDAKEALAGGLVSEVVPGDQLMARARELAMEIAEETAPVAIAITRQMLWRLGSEASPDGAFAIDDHYTDELGRGPDVREGISAFLEKRKPAFPGTISKNMPTRFPWWEE